MIFGKIGNFDIDKFRSYLRKDKGKTVCNYLKKLNINKLINKPYLELMLDSIIFYVEDNYMEELLNDDEIRELFVSRHIFPSFDNYNINTCKKVLSRLLEIDDDEDEIFDLYRKFDKEVQFKLLYMLKDRKDVLNLIIERGSFLLISKILNDNMIDLVSYNIDIEELFRTGKEDYIDELREPSNFNRNNYKISPLLLTNELSEKIWNSYNIFKIRNIINDSVYLTNPLTINDYIKTKEETLILNSLKTPLNPLYQNIYDKYLIQLEINGLLYDKKNNNFNEIFKLNSRLRNSLTPLEEEVFNELDSKKINNKEDLFNTLKSLNEEALANYIIDFHFEDIFFDVMLDLKELVNFNDRGHIKLDDNHLRLYRRILEIDNLNVEEKVKLHLELKQYNMIDLFYDDMLEARKIVNNDIKNNTLNKDNIKKYKNEDLSKKYGVDIYVIKDTELCALVKSDIKYKNDLPTGYSYSLAGYKLTGTYKPFQVENFVYDTSCLNPNQIMHIFPEDSYTTPPIFGSAESSSSRVNKLLMTKELLESDSDYSEVLIFEHGSIETPIDIDIPSLPILALYCADYAIPPSTIDYAKNNNLGIVFVQKTLSRKPNFGPSITSGNVNNIYYSEMFNNSYNEERRNKIKSKE